MEGSAQLRHENVHKENGETCGMTEVREGSKQLFQTLKGEAGDTL